MTESLPRRGHPGDWIDPERAIYGTITLMSVLAAYDGWEDRVRFSGLLIVIVTPTIALAVAHLFAEGLGEQIKLGRKLHREEWRGLLSLDAQYGLTAVPPLVFLLVAWLLDLDPATIGRVIVYAGVVTLGAYAVLAGYRAGLRGGRLVRTASAGVLIGLFVVTLQIWLKPH